MAKKAAKGEATRTETLTLRVTPKIKYGLELLARKQHRTLAGVAEWSFEKALNDVQEGLNTYYKYTEDDYIHSDNIPAGEDGCYINTLSDIWDPDEAYRFINLAYAYKNFLSYEESVLWGIIQNNGYYWTKTYSDDKKEIWSVSLRSSLIITHVKSDWDSLKQVVEGKKELIEIPFYIPATGSDGDRRFIDKTILNTKNTPTFTQTSPIPSSTPTSQIYTNGF